MSRGAEVVVVGSGAAGGWAAKTLSEAGHEVLVLEAGPALPQSAAPPAAGTREWVKAVPGTPSDADWRARKPVQSQYPGCFELTQHLFVDDGQNPYTSAADPFFWIRGRQLGGRTLWWGRVMLRLSEKELGDADDGHGIPWPLDSNDLAPHYDEVERFYRVCGSRDGLPQLPDGRYCDPLPLSESEALFVERMRERYPDRPVIAARGILAERTADGWPRESSVGSSLAAARATGRLAIRTGAVARRIVCDPVSGLATGVDVVDTQTGKDERIAARAVVVACSTIESVRLLLNSASEAHPGGLGNGSGLLGTHLMDHLQVFVSGTVPAQPEWSADRDLTGPFGLYIPRFRNLAAGGDLPFSRGYGIEAWIQRRGFSPSGPPAGRAAFALTGYCETLPRPENRVVLDPAQRDAWGIPCARIEYRTDANAERMAEDCLAEMRAMISIMDADISAEGVRSPGMGIHEVGGVRMGVDPSSSVSSGDAQLWDAPNVFVPDGSAWPSAGYQNPTLTIMAITDRACRKLSADLGRGTFRTRGRS